MVTTAALLTQISLVRFQVAELYVFNGPVA